MVLWVQEDASGFDPYFYFTLMRWRRFHPILYTPASDEDPLDAAYRKQLPANGDNFVFIPGGRPNRVNWPFVEAISKRIGPIPLSEGAWDLTITAAVTPMSPSDVFHIDLKTGPSQTTSLPALLQAVYWVDEILSEFVDRNCCCRKPCCCGKFGDDCAVRAEAEVSAFWACFPWFPCPYFLHKLQMDGDAESVFTEMHERALLAVNAILGRYGVALQHLTFGPLDGIVLEVFPVLGGGYAGIHREGHHLNFMTIPAMQMHLRQGLTVNRESNNDWENSYPDEWYETFDQYLEAMRVK